MDFKAIRHRYYKLGKSRVEILRRLGHFIPEEGITQEVERSILFYIEEHGQLQELIRLIEEREAELAADNT